MTKQTLETTTQEPPLPGWVRVVREPMAHAERGRFAELVDGKIDHPSDVMRLLGPKAQLEDVEVFYLLLLNTQARVMDMVEVSRGLLDGTLVHPREVFRPAFVRNAASVVLAHNHPSGDPTPSDEDHAITRQMVVAGKILGVPVHDHVILGDGERYVSFAAEGMI